MNKATYIILVSFVSMSIAQLLKPIMYYLINKEIDLKILFDSGGLPSSHTSTVVTLASTVGLIEGYDSTLFAISVILALLTMYDAANVRYYSGKNIKLTKQLIEDLKSSTDFLVKFTHPIYSEKIKEILGHSWFEVFSGAVLGLAVTGVLYIMFF